MSFLKVLGICLLCMAIPLFLGDMLIYLTGTKLAVDKVLMFWGGMFYLYFTRSDWNE